VSCSCWAGFDLFLRVLRYAKYYFALRELSDHKDALPAKPLTDAQARRLETGSTQLQRRAADARLKVRILFCFTL
jgi:hypothetical protein